MIVDVGDTCIYICNNNNEYQTKYPSENDIKNFWTNTSGKEYNQQQSRTLDNLKKGASNTPSMFLNGITTSDET